ncbi:MAG: hypothetical protein AB4372_32160 [Xenococcus sp. (in: cyanobacteria)]
MRAILLILGLSLLIACQQVLESRVRYIGSTVPRNHREKVIFDYFHALKDKRYADAYNLRAWNATISPISLENFIEVHDQNHSSLATEISIGKERKLNSSNNSQCGYYYIVYASKPGSSVLTSGVISMDSKPNEPTICLVSYNSAFGSIP